MGEHTLSHSFWRQSIGVILADAKEGRVFLEQFLEALSFHNLNRHLLAHHLITLGHLTRVCRTSPTHTGRAWVSQGNQKHCGHEDHHDLPVGRYHRSMRAENCRSFMLSLQTGPCQGQESNRHDVLCTIEQHRIHHCRSVHSVFPFRLRESFLSIPTASGHGTRAGRSVNI